jgi:hypothetical protein
MGNELDILAVEVDFDNEDFLSESILDIERCHPVSGVEYCYRISCDARQQASVVRHLPHIFQCCAFSTIKVILSESRSCETLIDRMDKLYG